MWVKVFIDFFKRRVGMEMRKLGIEYRVWGDKIIVLMGGYFSEFGGKGIILYWRYIFGYFWSVDEIKFVKLGVVI